MSQRLPEQALYDIRARELDLVIAVEYPGQAASSHAELDRVPLTTDAVRLAVPATGEWAKARGLKDVATAPWVMEPRPAASRVWAEQLCRSAGFEPEVRFETDDLETHAALVESGNAVAILPGLMTVRRQPNVRTVDLTGDPRRSVYTVTRKALADSPAILACRAALAEVVPATF